MNSRRSFLGSILVAAAAPAITRASSLMRVKPLADASQWHHYCLVRGQGKTFRYIDGYLIDGSITSDKLAQYEMTYVDAQGVETCPTQTAEVWATEDYAPLWAKGIQLLDNGIYLVGT